MNSNGILTNFRQIDIFAGGLDENIIANQHFIASRAYHHDSLTWCVQEKQPIALWKNLFRLCEDPSVYAIYFLMAVLSIFFAYFMQQFEELQPKWDWHRITTVAFRGMCSMPSEFNPKIVPTRIFFSFCLFGSLVFSVSILAFYIKALSSVMYEDQVKSIQEIIEKSFKLVGDGFAQQHLVKQKQVNKNIEFSLNNKY